MSAVEFVRSRGKECTKHTTLTNDGTDTTPSGLVASTTKFLSHVRLPLAAATPIVSNGIEPRRFRRRMKGLVHKRLWVRNKLATVLACHATTNGAAPSSRTMRTRTAGRPDNAAAMFVGTVVVVAVEQ